MLPTFLNRVKYPVLCAHDDVVRLVVPRRSAREGRVKILVVRLDSIGDFVLWLDAASALRERYPATKYEITLLGNDVWTDLAARLPQFDRVVTVNRAAFVRNPVYRFTLLAKLRNEGYATVIDPRYSRELLFSAAIAKVSGAPERIGFEGDHANISPAHRVMSDRWYTRLIPAARRPMMELDRNAEFTRGLGVAGFTASLPRLDIAARAPEGLAATGYFVVCPGAGWSGRMWPIEQFALLADRIHAETLWTAVICGNPADTARARKLEGLLKAPVRNLAGQTSVVELVQTVAGARLLVANDTGAVHIAASVRTPALCILGGGQYGRFLPYRESLDTGSLPAVVNHPMECYGCGWHCIHSVPAGAAVPCVAGVSADDAWARLRSMGLRK